MPVWSKGRVQTKKDTLVLQDGVWAWSQQPHPVKSNFVQKPNNQPRIGRTWEMDQAKDKERYHDCNL
jgi:hypothetical protein